MCKTLWKFTTKTPERCHWRLVFIGNFEQISHNILVFPLVNDSWGQSSSPMHIQSHEKTRDQYIVCVQSYQLLALSSFSIYTVLFILCFSEGTKLHNILFNSHRNWLQEISILNIKALLKIMCTVFLGRTYSAVKEVINPFSISSKSCCPAAI